MKYKKFFLSNAVYRRKRTWTVFFMDKDEQTVTKSIEEMLGYMRHLYREEKLDMAVAEIGNKRLFIDGSETVVTVSLADNSGHEFYLGYSISAMRYQYLTRHYPLRKIGIFDDDDQALLDCASGAVKPLADYFSKRVLGSNYNF